MTQVKKTANPKVTIIASKGPIRQSTIYWKTATSWNGWSPSAAIRMAISFSTIPAATSSKTWAPSNMSRKESSGIISASRMNKRRAARRLVQGSKVQGFNQNSILSDLERLNP